VTDEDHAARNATGEGGTSYGFVCFAAQDWWYHSQAHSDFQLMRHLARRHPVLVVNSIGLRMPMPGRTTTPVRRVVRKVGSMARAVRAPLPELPDFHVMSPVSLPVYGRPRLTSLNARAVAGQVSAVSRRLGMRRPACVVTIPTAEPVVRHLAHGPLIVNRADKHSLFPEADQEVIEEHERRLLGSADTVVYASHALMAADAPLVGARARFLDHGVDLEHFRRRTAAEEPADLQAIPHPRIGFFGTLDALVDYALVERVARDIPEASVVLVGPATVDISRVAGIPNVHVLGLRPYEDMPRYGSGFDVAIMPWASTEWIHWCNPIKLKEYLALGLPVVSTAYPEVDYYREVVRVAGNPAEYVAEIRAALSTLRDPAAESARRRRVADDSWAGRAALLERFAAEATLGP